MGRKHVSDPIATTAYIYSILSIMIFVVVVGAAAVVVCMQKRARLDLHVLKIITSIFNLTLTDRSITI